MSSADLLRHVTETIVERFRPKRIILFGSHARGRAGPASDLDLFYRNGESPPPTERVIEVSSVFGLRPWSLDLVVYTPEEVARLRHIKGSLLSVIEKEGKVLYERA
jgi:predicted nucleotidyltransferase